MTLPAPIIPAVLVPMERLAMGPRKPQLKRVTISGTQPFMVATSVTEPVAVTQPPSRPPLSAPCTALKAPLRPSQRQQPVLAALRRPLAPTRAMQRSKALVARVPLCAGEETAARPSPRASTVTGAARATPALRTPRLASLISAAIPCLARYLRAPGILAVKGVIGTRSTA